MSQMRRIVIVTLMPPRGETGVQTHFGQLVELARSRDLQANVVTPHGGPFLARKLVALVARSTRLISREISTILVRWLQFGIVRRQLVNLLQQRTEQPITFYAQDPLSARAALRVRRKGRDKVVCVVHFNVAEADECVAKGLTREGGALYQHMMRNEAHALPRVDRIIFVSSFMQKTLARRLPEISAVPQEVLPNFIAEPLEQAVVSPSRDLLTIGTLEPRKNQGFLLKVLAATRDKGYSYQLTLAGDGPSRAEFERLASELGLEEQVEFLGFYHDAWRLLPGHRAYVHAAQMENMPLTLIEALAFSRPILAPATGGIPEIVRDGENGRHWSLDDVDAASDMLIELMEDEECLSAFSASAADRYRSHFCIDAVGSRWLAALA
jgi:glycosyltransferase involved in cell wall biosynthesis